MFALAEDYFRAGLFDRAEQLVSAALRTAAPSRARRCAICCASTSNSATGSRRSPFTISSWRSPRQSIRPRSRTITASSPSTRASAGDFDAAREHLHRARDVQRNFPRGALIRADIALDMNEPELAALLCQRVVELHPRLLALALPRVMRAVRGSDVGEISSGASALDSPGSGRARGACICSASSPASNRRISCATVCPTCCAKIRASAKSSRALAGDPAQLTRRAARRARHGARPHPAAHAALSLRRLRLRQRRAFLAVPRLPQLGCVRAGGAAGSDAGHAPPLSGSQPCGLLRDRS